MTTMKFECWKQDTKLRAMGDSQRTSGAGFRAKNLAWVQAVIGLIGFAAMLELAPRLGLVSPRYLPPFSVIAVALVNEIQQAQF